MRASKQSRVAGLEYSEKDVQLPVKGADVVLRPGLSVHVYGSVVGVYCARLHAGKGFVELPSSDLQAIVEHFRSSEERETPDSVSCGHSSKS